MFLDSCLTQGSLDGRDLDQHKPLPSWGPACMRNSEAGQQAQAQTLNKPEAEQRGKRIAKSYRVQIQRVISGFINWQSVFVSQEHQQPL